MKKKHAKAISRRSIKTLKKGKKVAQKRSSTIHSRRLIKRASSVWISKNFGDVLSALSKE